MPQKCMKDFIHNFFNPPKCTKPTETKKKVTRKKKKKVGLTPIQRQLMETNDFMKHKLSEFEACSTETERVLLVYSSIPHEATSIDRLWPTELTNKDSRIRRELSTKGKESFNRGEHDLALESYNEAIMFSSGKGLAHTLARRAAFLLQTKDHLLALRDLSIALEYGCLETELLDFLLDHHMAHQHQDLVVGQRMQRMNIASFKEQKKSQWIAKIRSVLDEFEDIKKLSSTDARQMKAVKMEEIIGSIKKAAKEENFDTNFESKRLEVPQLQTINPSYPSFSGKVEVVIRPQEKEKGRQVVALKDIQVGELILVEDPICSLLCPEKLQNISSHCQHCHLFTKAPIPCEICCTVVFCSKECRHIACESYHKYECEMRLFELISLEGKEMFGYFMALRAVTQRDIKFFIENKDMFEVFLNIEEPIFPLDEPIYSGSDYKTLMNLTTHMEDQTESLAMKNAVISVFFLRFLQHGKYFKHHVPQKRKNDHSLHPTEKLILHILHHLISVQCFNSQQVTKLSSDSAKYEWEGMGTSISTSLALVNHSCDPNTFRFNLNKTTVLIANRHISAGQEVTVSYIMDYQTYGIEKREYYMLRHYVFQCECIACTENWPVLDDLPDELARIPNFEQERCYTVMHGDKKDICDEINSARWMADFGLNSDSFEVAQEALDLLSVALEKHIRKPHMFYVEAAQMAEKFAINQYCRMPLKFESEKVDEQSTNNKNHTRHEIDRDALLKDKRERIIQKMSVTDSPTGESSPERLEGTNKLIQTFETVKESSPTTKIPARNKSPTLRIFSSGGQQTENGHRKKSVLDRLDDTKFRPSEEVHKLDQIKTYKLELAKSLRRFSAKEEMSERMAAFEIKDDKNHQLQSTKENSQRSEKSENSGRRPRSQSANNTDCLREAPGKIQNHKSVFKLDSIADLETAYVGSNQDFAKDEELSEKILKEIDMNRTKIREERKEQKKENYTCNSNGVNEFDNMSTKRQILLKKDADANALISEKEEKIKRLIDISLKKEKNLLEKKSKLQNLCEKSKRMVEMAKQKELEFQRAEQAFQEAVDVKQEPKDKKLSKVNKKNQRESGTRGEQSNGLKSENDDDDLLLFLRKSHKNKTNIYTFSNNDGSETKTKISNSSKEPSKTLSPTTHSNEVPIHENADYYGSQILTQENKDGIYDKCDILSELSVNENTVVAANEKLEKDGCPQTQLSSEIVKEKQKEVKKPSEENNCGNCEVDNTIPEGVDNINGNDEQWEREISEIITSIEQKSSVRRHESETIVNEKEDGMSNQTNTNSFSCQEGYFNSWKTDRCSLSPGSPSSRQASRSPSRSPRYSHSPIMAGRIRSNVSTSTDSEWSEDENKQPNGINSRKGRQRRNLPPVTFRTNLNRRKSLSENCLLPNRENQGQNQTKNLDAFGLPRLDNRQKRSVSLIRDSFMARKESKPLNQMERKVIQNQLSKETKTSCATEFKTMFENGSVTNLSRSVRSITPYKRPQVDATHLTKVKNKFKEADTGGSKLPVPNYKPRPPLPKARPPPPPMMF